jgi:HEPN domain-containing protein
MSKALSQLWLAKAAEDLTVARLVLTEEHYSHVCFLSQQCLEKTLKAFLLEKASNYPRTHRLVDLLGACTEIEATFANFLPDCTVIDQYYIPTRYPDAVPGGLPGGLPGKSEAEEAVSIAEKIVDFVVLRL